MPTLFWTEIHKEFEKTVNWISTFKNIDIEKTILPEMLLFTEHFSENYDPNEKEKMKHFEFAEESIHSMIDASTLNFIRENFEGREFKKLKDNIKIAVMGPLKSSDETNLGNLTQARNMLYELETAAFEISIGSNVTKELEDINYLIGDIKINIQNKRILNEEKLEDNFNEAVSQLINKNGIHKDKNSFGFVALSLEKIYGLDRGVLPVNNKDELETRLNRIRLEMNEKTEPFFRKAFEENGEDFRLLGRMYFYKGVVLFRDTGSTSFFRRFIIDIKQNSPYKHIVELIDNRNL